MNRVGMTLGVLTLAACHHQPTMKVEVAPPPVPHQQVTPPPISRPSTSPSAGLAVDTTTEARVELDTHGAEVDVRPILDFLASKAGISLIYSPDVNKKVRLHLIDVPVSQAIQSVLSVANLTLQSTNSASKVPSVPAVVFYQLPVNVDSLSADAIMKRFGVGRGVAELIVNARVKP